MLVAPPLQSPLPDTLALTNGSVLRLRSRNQVEVWGVNISEHFLITRCASNPHSVDVVFLTDHNLKFPNPSAVE